MTTLKVRNFRRKAGKMKKIGILTFHRAANYGAVLQAYALCNIIKNIGEIPEIVNYCGNVIDKRYTKIIPTSPQTLRGLIGMLLNIPIRLRKRKVFDDYINKYLPLGPKATTLAELKNISTNYDKVIVGSDQVWSAKTSNFDTRYLLDFVPSNKKYAYAASFGSDYIKPDLKKSYKNLLGDFQKITVREAAGQKIMLDLLQQETEVALDPALLMTSKEWDLAVHNNSKLQKEKFIFVYLIQENNSIVNFAVKMSRITGYPIYCVNSSWKRKFHAKFYRCVSPFQWVQMLKHSEMVITNSFHALVFSINYHKKFWCDLLAPPAETNGRFKSILQLLDLEKRIVSYDADGKQLKEEIDWNGVEQILDTERKKSIALLKSMVR